MTIATGNDVAYGSGGYYDARISYSVANISDTVARVTYHEYAYHNTSLYDSSNAAADGGDIASGSFGAKSYSSGSAGTMTYRSGTKDFTRVYGGSTVDQTFWVEGLADGSGGGARSTVSVTIPIDARPVTVPLAPASATISNVTSDGFRVSFPEPTDWKGNVGSYFVRVSSNSFATYEEYAVPYGTNLKDITGRSPGAAYQVRVYAINSAGTSTGYASASTTTAAAVPSAGKTPSLSSLTDTSVVASWADPDLWNGDDSSDFDLQIDDQTNFVGATEYEVLDANSKTLTGLTGNTTRYLRDRAKNSAGDGQFSSAATLLTKPSKCTGVSATAITPTTATAVATAPVGGASSYRLQVATDAGFTALVHDSTGTTLSRALSGLNSATRHYMRWLASNSSGDMGWTTTVTFDTLAGAYVRDGGTLKTSTAHVWDGDSGTGGTLKAAAAYIWRSGAWRR